MLCGPAVPKKLQAVLPFKSKPKLDEAKSRKRDKDGNKPATGYLKKRALVRRRPAAQGACQGALGSVAADAWPLIHRLAATPTPLHRHPPWSQVMEPDERQKHAVLQQIRTIKNDKLAKRKAKCGQTPPFLGISLPPWHCLTLALRCLALPFVDLSLPFPAFP